jgi:hypothetical protein
MKDLEKKLMDDLKASSPRMYHVANVVGPEKLAKFKRIVDVVSGESKRRSQQSLNDKKDDIERLGENNKIIKNSIIITKAKLGKLRCDNIEETLEIFYKKIKEAGLSKNVDEYIKNYYLFLTSITSIDFCKLSLSVISNILKAQNFGSVDYNVPNFDYLKWEQEMMNEFDDMLKNLNLSKKSSRRNSSIKKSSRRNSSA